MKERRSTELNAMAKIFLFIILIPIIVNEAFDQFDDSVHFKLIWQPESLMPSQLLGRYKTGDLDSSVLFISTGLDEKYLCALPQTSGSNKPKIETYTGPTPHQLMASLYAQRACTYRIEIYWTYELCHGRYLLQYHDEKDANGKTSSPRSDYYLGQYLDERTIQDDEQFDQLNPPKRKVDQQMLPYYPIKFTQGTVCDINGKPRITTIQYVCFADGLNQIYSLEEVSSCEYQVVVLTKRLCSHPAFQPNIVKEHDVACYPVDSSPFRPKALDQWEVSQRMEFQQQFASTNRHSDLVVESISKPTTQYPTTTTTTTTTTTASTPLPIDRQLISNFLSGEYCLQGGAGWWKYQYCHGRQVIQFHEDDQVGRVEIVLGIWNRDAHKKWIDEHQHKKPIRIDGSIKQVSQLYVNGDTCQEVDTPRTVEVRLRCRHTEGNQNSITLYLLEPRVCQYILGIESAMLCELIQMVDDDGLLPQSSKP